MEMYCKGHKNALTLCVIAMETQEAIDIITAAVRDAPDVRALFLSGSYGNGMADAYSDIDFILVAGGGASDAVAALWRDAISRTGEIVLWRDRTTRRSLINAITADWMRTDVVIVKPDDMRAEAQSGLRPLFDHDGIFDHLAKNSKDKARDLARITYQIEEFIRILGLLHLVAGREEYLNGVLGVFHLRNLLVELMVEETAAPDRGGALHLNRLLTDEQKDVLTALPAPLPNRDALISAHLAYARAYLPRARRLCAEWGAAWPERFEAVTWQHLRSSLGIERPYD